MDSSSPLETLSPTLAQPLEEIDNGKKSPRPATTSKPKGDSTPDVAVSPPSDKEASSDDEGPEDPLPKKVKKKTRPTNRPADAPTQSQPSQSSQPKRAKEEYRLCPYCRQWPILGPHEFCSVECERGAGAAKRNAFFSPIKELDPNDRISQAIYHKFCQEWADPSGQVVRPDVHKIYHITLPFYEDRFLDAIARVQVHGGSNTKSAWFGCQCICDIGAKSDDLCNSRSCGICMAIKSGFDELAFGKATTNGIYGPGIYAHRNPAMAHRFTVRKADHDRRVIILCSIVELEPSPPVANVLEYGAMVDPTGRVFCARKDLIIPRRLVVYSVPSSSTPTPRGNGT